MVAVDQSDQSNPSLQSWNGFAAGIGAALLVVNVVNERSILRLYFYGKQILYCRNNLIS